MGLVGLITIGVSIILMLINFRAKETTWLIELSESFSIVLKCRTKSISSYYLMMCCIWLTRYDSAWDARKGNTVTWLSSCGKWDSHVSFWISHRFSELILWWELLLSETSYLLLQNISWITVWYRLPSHTSRKHHTALLQNKENKTSYWRQKTIDFMERLEVFHRSSEFTCTEPSIIRHLR